MTDQAGCNVPHYHECDLKDAEIDKEKKEEGEGGGGGGGRRGEGVVQRERGGRSGTKTDNLGRQRMNK